MKGDRGDERRPCEVDIAVSSVLDGSERQELREDREGSEPALWRMNLTALSQDHNLYFIAHEDRIHVYEPEFPSQQLTRKCFSWAVARSGSRLTGIFHRSQSHWINRLCLEYLGHEEVIATVHDDGDFVVCSLRSVRNAMEAALQGNAGRLHAAEKIRYLYRTNVGASAWGIAVHQEARLLAASANSCRITVFAPALSPTGTWNPALDATDRRTDKELVLSGHQNNIPAIAFCNTGADPQGRYLVSTDIMGVVIIWDIWSKCTVKQIQMTAVRHAGINEDYPGWSVTCLDAKSFQCVENDFELVGYERDAVDKLKVNTSRSHAGLGDFPSYGEHSSVVINGVPPSRARRHLVVSGRDDGSDLSLDLEPMVEEEPGEELDEDNIDEEYAIHAGDAGEWDDSEADDFFPSISFNSGLAPADDFEDTDDWGMDSDSMAEVLYDTVDFGPRPAADSDVNFEDFLQGRQDVRSPFRLSAEQLPPIAPFGSPRKSRRNPPPAPQPPGITLPFSILHTGQKIVTLLRPPFSKLAAKSIDPCRDVRTMHGRLLNQYERLNLTAHIPELSVVILATQMGRAAVFSLTELPKSATGKDAIFSRASRRKRGIGRHGEDEDKDAGRYALRLDWILPLVSQEAQNQRPWAPLVGLAVSPIQHGGSGPGGAGPSSASGLRRWRLMLTYQDSSVLSYELSRGGGFGESVLVF